MGDSILSQAEIDALLNGDSDKNDDPQPGLTGDDNIRPYDPNTQRRVVRERLQALEIINERFARQFRMGLFNLLRRSPDITVGAIRIQPYHEFARNLPVPTNLNLIHLKPLRGTGLVVFSPSLVFIAVDNLFGGDGLQSGKQLPLGPALLGRVLDGSGKPLDGLPAPDTTETGALITQPFNPLQRTPIEHVLDTGVRPINALLTVGRGQRMGLFAGSGVGKSVLLGMMARYTQADVIVVGLIGERGREVKDFIENILGAEGRARSVVIAAPADVSPLLRMQGAAYATRIAEDFRDRGKHVLAYT